MMERLQGKGTHNATLKKKENGGKQNVTWTFKCFVSAMMEHLLPKLGWQRAKEVKVNIKEGWGERMRSEVKWHCRVGWWGVCGRQGCAPRYPLPWTRQLFVWPSRSLVQTLEHAPLHPNSRNFTGATHHICFGIAVWGIQTGSLQGIGLEIKISCWFSNCIIEVCSTQSSPVASLFFSC